MISDCVKNCWIKEELLHFQHIHTNDDGGTMYKSCFNYFIFSFCSLEYKLFKDALFSQHIYTYSLIHSYTLWFLSLFKVINPLPNWILHSTHGLIIHKKKQENCAEKTKEQKSTIKNQFQGFLVLSLKAIKNNALCFEYNHYIYPVFFLDSFFTLSFLPFFLLAYPVYSPIPQKLDFVQKKSYGLKSSD